AEGCHGHLGRWADDRGDRDKRGASDRGVARVPGRSGQRTLLRQLRRIDDSAGAERAGLLVLPQSLRGRRHLRELRRIDDGAGAECGGLLVLPERVGGGMLLTAPVSWSKPARLPWWDAREARSACRGGDVPGDWHGFRIMGRPSYSWPPSPGAPDASFPP